MERMSCESCRRLATPDLDQRQTIDEDISIHVPGLSRWTGDICIAKIARYVEVDEKERWDASEAICMCVICLYGAI